MRTVVVGFKEWAKMKKTTNESARLTDTAITVVATLLVAVTWAVLRG